MRACTVCGRKTQVGSRCEVHPRRDEKRQSPAYRKARAQTLEEEYVCWLCLGPPTEDDPLTADHIVSVDEGGQDTRANMHAAHLSCNSRRGQAQQEGR